MCYDVFLCAVTVLEEKLSCSAHLSLRKIQNTNHKVHSCLNKICRHVLYQHVTTPY